MREGIHNERRSKEVSHSSCTLLGIWLKPCTSNDEKDLPDAFLRRCLFHYVEFPDHERLIEIVKLHFHDTSEKMIHKAVERFSELRGAMEKDKVAVGKKVSTSELIDWFDALRSRPQEEVLIKLEDQLPFASVLLKSWDDQSRYLTRG